MKLNSYILLFCLVFVLTNSNLFGQIIVYPAPNGAALSDDYIVFANGKKIDIYSAPGMLENGGDYSFAYFDFEGQVNVQVITSYPLENLEIKPMDNQKYKVSKNSIEFSFDSPSNISIEPNGKTHPLILFANGKLNYTLDKNNPDIKYFGPGIHKPELIELTDNQTLYIAGGAIVKGGVIAKGKNIKIVGRGILDGGDWGRFKGPVRSCMFRIQDASNVTIDGIITKDSWGWTLRVGGSNNVTIKNYKIIGTRCANEDGIDIVNTKNITIQNCFIRTDDDCIAIKGFGEGNNQACDSIYISQCTFWTDNASIFRIGAECTAEAMQNIFVNDIDVIHMENDQANNDTYSLRYDFCITLHPAENMPIQNCVFENFRVAWEGQSNLIECRPYITQWSKPPFGRIENIVFRNITCTSSHKSENGQGRISVVGPGADYYVKNVQFENIVWNGECITQDSRDVTISGYSNNIVFKCKQ